MFNCRFTLPFKGESEITCQVLKTINCNIKKTIISFFTKKEIFQRQWLVAYKVIDI